MSRQQARESIDIVAVEPTSPGEVVVAERPGKLHRTLDRLSLSGLIKGLSETESADTAVVEPVRHAATDPGNHSQYKIGSKAGALSLTALLLITGAACGSKGTTTSTGPRTTAAAPPPPTTPEATTSTTRLSPPTTEAAGFVPTHSIAVTPENNLNTSGSGGYTSTGEFKWSAPVSLADAPLLPGFISSAEVAAVCDNFDPQTDALIPISLTMTNTTENFTQTLDVNTTLAVNAAGSPTVANEELDVIANYAAGPACDPMTNNADEGDAANYWDFTCSDMPADTPCTESAYVILPNYFSPANPAGDPSVLAAAVLLTNNEAFTLEGGPVPAGL